MNKLLLPLLLMAGSGHLLAFPAQTGSQTLANEDNTLIFSWSCDNGTLRYRVESRLEGTESRQVIESSPLGLVRPDADFSRGLNFVSASPVRTIAEHYTLPTGKQSRIDFRALEQTFRFANPQGKCLDLIVRTHANGIAFRYRFPEQDGHIHTVNNETTGFKLAPDGQAWLLPYMKVAEWAPSYESEWQNKTPIGTPAPEAVGWSLPALFHSAGHWLMLAEADASPDFYAVHLQPDCPDGLYRVRLPEPEETYGVAAQEAVSILPWMTPWRVIIVGLTPAAIVESTLVTDLSRASTLSDTSWIKPGRVSWSWWSDPSSPSQYDRLVPFVDLAAELGWEYSLIDLGWHEMGAGGDIQKLIGYAQTRGVGLFLWYNSGGLHSQVNGGPRNLMMDPLLRAAELEKISRWGVKGIKVDFMQSDKQYVMKLYEDILRDAARYHLMVDFHGCTIPRGWNRTYPNLMTMEAIRGAEQYWDVNFAENAHTFHTIYPFTRNAVGSMDYTPVIFNDAPGKQKHLTTNAHELALAVVFESGLQHFVDTPAAYLQSPPYVVAFLKAVPVAWDETRWLGGTPGDRILLARRKGDLWFIAGLNGTQAPIAVKVSLSFLEEEPCTLSLIVDGATPREFGHIDRTATRSEELSITMAGRGGFAAMLKPQAKTQR